MSVNKQFKLAEKAIAEQRQLVAELNALVKSVERSEKTVIDLNAELSEINQKYQGPRTTQEDIAYLTGLLKCAHRKLDWEKQLASLQKRTPTLLQKITGLMNDPINPPTDEMRALMLHALQGVQASIERLEKAKA